MSEIRLNNKIKPTMDSTMKNVQWTLKTIYKIDRIMLFIMFSNILLNVALSFASIYMIKKIIEILLMDIIFVNKVKYISIFLISICLLQLINNIVGVYLQKRIQRIKQSIFLEYKHKFLEIPYEMLEDPNVLDLQEKAKAACFYDGSAIDNMFNYIIDLGVTCMNIIIAVNAVMVLNIYIIIIIFILSIIKYVHLIKMKNWDKINTWDQLANVGRKINYYDYVAENSSFSKEIRINNLSHYLNEKEEIEQVKVDIIRRRHFKSWIRCNTKMSVCDMAQLVTMYVWLIYMVSFQNLSVANFTFYLGLVTSFSDASTHLYDLFASMKQSSLQINDLKTFAAICCSKNSQLNNKKYKNNEYIKFENVSYTYLGQKHKALKNINISISKGEKIAIVGLNGAGKSTFIKLLCGLYVPTEGSIFLKDKNINNIDMRKHVSSVFQDIEVPCMSVLENVSLDVEGDSLSVDNCLKKAGLYNCVKNYGEKTNQQLGKYIYQEGVEMSGGEKQKLLFSRALYKNSEIMILDEPTSALDPIAEMETYYLFNQALKEKTAIFISHRLASTKFCDRIFYFENGEIVEVGTHDELIAKNGKYKYMYDIQAKNFILEE